MHSLLTKFSKTAAESEFTRSQAFTDDGDLYSSDATSWGSQAGFGNLSHGIPSFEIPEVADVRTHTIAAFFLLSSRPSALSIFAHVHQRCRGPQLQNQDQPRDHYACFLLPRRRYRGGRLARHRWKRGRCVLRLTLKDLGPSLDATTASGTVKKVVEINPYLLGTLAGTAGTYIPTQYILSPVNRLVHSRLSVLGDLPRDALPLA